MKRIQLIIGALAILSTANSFADKNCPCDNNHCERPSDQLVNILNDQDGWAAYKNGVRGGADGWVYHVTTNKDNDKDATPIKGSLREGLEASCPLWIVFDIDGTIKLKQEIDVKSQKTLDGRGQNIRIDTSTTACQDGDKHTAYGALSIEHQNDIAIFNIDFDDNFPDWEKDCEKSDAINIKYSQQIWIHQNSFKKWNDGAIDANQGSDKITISWNKFKNIRQPVAIRDGRTSFHHNFCSSVITRCPHVVRKNNSSSDEIFLHSYNNFIKDWHENDVYTAKGKNTNLLSEYDFFSAGSHSEDELRGIKCGEKKSNCAKMQFENIWINKHNGHTIDIIENPSVDKKLKEDSRNLSTIDKCNQKEDDDKKTCFQQLKNDVINNSGNTLSNY